MKNRACKIQNPPPPSSSTNNWTLINLYKSTCKNLTVKSEHQNGEN